MTKPSNAWKRRININTIAIILFSLTLFGLGLYWRSLALPSSIVDSCLEQYDVATNQQELNDCLYRNGELVDRDQKQKELIYIITTILSSAGLLAAFVYRNHSKAIFNQENQ